MIQYGSGTRMAPTPANDWHFEAFMIENLQVIRLPAGLNSECQKTTDFSFKSWSSVSLNRTFWCL
jgi:hypothetical protein